MKRLAIILATAGLLIALCATSPTLGSIPWGSACGCGDGIRANRLTLFNPFRDKSPERAAEHLLVTRGDLLTYDLRYREDAGDLVELSYRVIRRRDGASGSYAATLKRTPTGWDITSAGGFF